MCAMGWLLWMISNKRHSCRCTFAAHILRPDACLYFANVCLVEQGHAKAALPYSATYAEWHVISKEFLMEIEVLSILLSGNLQLTFQSLLVYAYAHRGEFKSTVQYRIPYHYVAVKSA